MARRTGFTTLASLVREMMLPPPALELVLEDAVLLLDVPDQILLMPVHPAGERY